MLSIPIQGIIMWLHVVSVIGWTGAALTFLVSIRPNLGKLSPQASSEFIIKVFPRFVKSVQIFTIFTLIFGPLLAFSMADGTPHAFDLVSPWSAFIVTGASFGITTFLLVFLALTPTERKIVNILTLMQKNNQHTPPKELQKLFKRLSCIPPVGVTLLLLAEVFMVAAAQF